MTEQTTTTAPPPAAFPAPAVTTWGQGGAAPAPASKRKSSTMVVAAAITVGVIGGGFGLVNVMKGETAATAQPAALIALPDPTAGPAIPGAAVPATIPGPQPAPAIITTTIPEPVVEPEPEPAPAQTGGGVQPVQGDISVAIPDGWEVLAAETGYVLLGTDGAEYRVLTSDGYTDAQSLAAAWLNSQDLQDVQVTDEGAATLPTSAVIDAYVATYEAVLVTQQGSLPVESIVFTYITQDGTGIILETTNAQGDFGSYATAYDLMQRSVEQSL
jgi:hypothetical protein